MNNYMIRKLQELDYRLYKRSRGFYGRDYYCINKRIIKLANAYLDNVSAFPQIHSKHTSNAIIVSLTSIPQRIQTTYLTIESLLRQSIRPDHIILYLAKDEFLDRKLPTKICKQMDRGLEVKYVDNIRSHKKYCYALQEYRDSLLVTADDDIIYPECMLSRLLEKYNRFPNSIICNRCNIIRRIGGKPMSYVRWKGNEDYESLDDIDEKDIFFTTGGGTLFPAWLLSEESVNVGKIMELCPTADDVWLNFMARLNGIDVHCLDPIDGHCLFNDVNSYTLAQDNIYGGKNDAYINRMADIYSMKL